MNSLRANIYWNLSAVLVVINVCLLSTVGCLPDPEPVPDDINRDHLVNASIAAALGIGSTVDSTPVPPPAPDNIPRPADCPDNCNNGTLGDGTIFLDCPTCDSNGDGNPDDPVTSTQEVQAEVDMEPMLVWHNSMIEAKKAGKPILVLLSEQPPTSVWDSPLIAKRVNELFTPLHAELTQGAHDTWLETLQPKGKSPVPGIVKSEDGSYKISSPSLVILNPDQTYREVNVNNRLFVVPPHSGELLKALEERITR